MKSDTYFFNEGFKCFDTDFSCRDGESCIDEDLVCDGAYDCFDGSDEINCITQSDENKISSGNSVHWV